jgi:predicted HAD superfamily Cof-like phosphohydrolase
MSENYDLVKSFNQQVLGIPPRAHVMQDMDEYRLSHTQLIEEAEEFLCACDEQDYIAAVDACIDSIVFAKGILYKLGVTSTEYDAIFAAVMKANMSKVSGTAEGREGFDAADATKPEDFVSPEDAIAEILQ